MTTVRGYRPVADLHRPQQRHRLLSMLPVDSTIAERRESERLYDLAHPPPEYRKGNHRGHYSALRLFIEESVRSGQIYTLSAIRLARQFGVSKSRVWQVINQYGVYKRRLANPKAQEQQS